MRAGGPAGAPVATSGAGLERRASIPCRMSAPEVTVAVPVKDRREQMLRCVDALLAQDHPSFEILVLDNESTDGTPQAIAGHVAGARVPVRIETLAGSVGHIRNLAGNLARGEFLAFTDSDCLPDPGWLRAATDALKADERLGVVQGRTLPEVEPVMGWPATIRVEEFTGLYEGCNLVFRRAAFAASSGFDEEVGHFWEDTAAGFALKRDGWKAAFAPAALVYHDVTYPGFWWHVKRMQKHQNLALVLARYPEMRRELLFARLFLQDRDAKFLALLAGVVLARRRPLLALLLAAPYVHMLLWRQDPKGPLGLTTEAANPKFYAQAIVYDTARVTGLLRGGVRNGQIVL